MLDQAIWRVSERKPPHYRNKAQRSPGAAIRANRSSDAPARPTKPARSPRRHARAAPPLPDGWEARLREQGRNLARAVEMLEQALTMLAEPRAEALARAQCLRGAGLIALIAASELLVVAGFHEAEQVVIGGTSSD